MRESSFSEISLEKLKFYLSQTFTNSFLKLNSQKNWFKFIILDTRDLKQSCCEAQQKGEKLKKPTKNHLRLSQKNMFLPAIFGNVSDIFLKLFSHFHKPLSSGTLFLSILWCYLLFKQNVKKKETFFRIFLSPPSTFLFSLRNFPRSFKFSSFEIFNIKKT